MAKNKASFSNQSLLPEVSVWGLNIKIGNSCFHLKKKKKKIAKRVIQRATVVFHLLLHLTIMPYSLLQVMQLTLGSFMSRLCQDSIWLEWARTLRLLQ